jgi:enterochelin esterase-like enzyme
MKRLVFVLTFLMMFGAVGMAQDAGGTITQEEFDSETLGRAYQYNIYLPPGYDASSEIYPVIYLLHGRGDSMAGWLNAKPDLDAMIADGSIPPMIAVMPDMPSSDRAGYYVDSQYTGSAAPAAEAVETAFFSDLIPHIDATYRTSAGREARLVGGYSMGGYGALRYALARPEMFVGALVLSPAVYIPFPPVDSSTREFGAFGMGDALFDDDTYTALNYPALLPQFRQSALGVSMFIAVGDDEWKNERPEDALHDLDMEAHMVFNQVARVPSIRSEFRVYDGGHDWDVWRRGFVEGLQFLSGAISIVGVGDAGMEPLVNPIDGPTVGSDGQDFAGGIAQSPDGSTYIALGAGGQVNGETHTGELDVAVVKRGADGAVMWTRQFGTAANDRPYGLAIDAQGDVIVAGYTAGDFDGAHPDASSDDAFVAKLSPDGEILWTLQFGDAAEADRAYGLALGDNGMIYVAGYTKGVLGGDHIGDKDIIVAAVTTEGTLSWADQFGGTGEDKGYAVAVSGDNVYLAGVFATDPGGLDAHLSAYTVGGEYLWTQILGTPDWDEGQGVAIGPDGTVYMTGFAAGALEGHEFFGDKDIFLAAYSPEGEFVWSDQVGGAGNDKGADIVVDASGRVTVAAFAESQYGASHGFDVRLLHYTGEGNPVALDFGTEGDDGADEYAEKNLFISLSGEELLLSGITTGSVSGALPNGASDVFVITVDPE